MKKSIMTLVLIGSIGIGYSFANDCNIIEGKNLESAVVAYGTAYENVLPSEAFKKALINLKAHCCTQVIKKSCTPDEIKNIQSPYPESEYLFDHLIDVALRRLDAVTGLAYNLSIDPTASERRTKVTEIANNPMGLPANAIESLYTGYRTIHKYTNKDIPIIIHAYNKNIATVSLGDKYDTICEIVKNIYQQIQTHNATIIWANTESASFFNWCRKLVKERVKKETGYIKILMVQKSNQLFDETTKAYTKKYFVEEKLIGLWGLISKVKDIFKTIVQQAPASKICSQ